MAKGKRHKNHRQQQRSTDRARKPDTSKTAAKGDGVLPSAGHPATAPPSTATPASSQAATVAGTPRGTDRVLGLGNLGNTCFFNSAVQVRPHGQTGRTIFCSSPVSPA